jgi:hypothetical protein
VLIARGFFISSKRESSTDIFAHPQGCRPALAGFGQYAALNPAWRHGLATSAWLLTASAQGRQSLVGSTEQQGLATARRSMRSGSGQGKLPKPSSRNRLRFSSIRARRRSSYSPSGSAAKLEVASGGTAIGSMGTEAARRPLSCSAACHQCELQSINA